MTAPADFHQTEFPPDARRRLIEIARQQSDLAAEAAALIAALSGAPAGVADHVAEAVADRDVDAIDRENLVTVPQAAAEWKCHPRTMRKRAEAAGAIVKVGGSIYVNRLTYGRGITFQNLPKFSISRPARIADNSTK